MPPKGSGIDWPPGTHPTELDKSIDGTRRKKGSRKGANPNIRNKGARERLKQQERILSKQGTQDAASEYVIDPNAELPMDEEARRVAFSQYVKNRHEALSALLRQPNISGAERSRIVREYHELVRKMETLRRSPSVGKAAQPTAAGEATPAPLQPAMEAGSSLAASASEITHLGRFYGCKTFDTARDVLHEMLINKEFSNEKEYIDALAEFERLATSGGSDTDKLGQLHGYVDGLVSARRAGATSLATTGAVHGETSAESVTIPAPEAATAVEENMHMKEATVPEVSTDSGTLTPSADPAMVPAAVTEQSAAVTEKPEETSPIITPTGYTLSRKDTPSPDGPPKIILPPSYETTDEPATPSEEASVVPSIVLPSSPEDAPSRTEEAEPPRVAVSADMPPGGGPPTPPEDKESVSATPPRGTPSPRDLLEYLNRVRKSQTEMEKVHQCLIEGFCSVEGTPLEGLTITPLIKKQFAVAKHSGSYHGSSTASHDLVEYLTTFAENELRRSEFEARTEKERAEREALHAVDKKLMAYLEGARKSQEEKLRVYDGIVPPGVDGNIIERLKDRPDLKEKFEVVKYRAGDEPYYSGTYAAARDLVEALALETEARLRDPGPTREGVEDTPPKPDGGEEGGAAAKPAGSSEAPRPPVEAVDGKDEGGKGEGDKPELPPHKERSPEEVAAFLEARKQYREYLSNVRAAKEAYNIAAAAYHTSFESHGFLSRFLLTEHKRLRDEMNAKRATYDELMADARTKLDARIEAGRKKFPGGRKPSTVHPEKREKLTYEKYVSVQEALLETQWKQMCDLMESLETRDGRPSEAQCRIMRCAKASWEKYKTMPLHQKLLWGSVIAAGFGGFAVVGAGATVGTIAGAAGAAFARRMAGGIVGAGTAIGVKLHGDKKAASLATESRAKLAEDWKDPKLDFVTARDRELEIRRKERAMKRNATLKAAGAAYLAGAGTSGAIHAAQALHAGASGADAAAASLSSLTAPAKAVYNTGVGIKNALFGAPEQGAIVTGTIETTAPARQVWELSKDVDLTKGELAYVPPSDGYIPDTSDLLNELMKSTAALPPVESVPEAAAAAAAVPQGGGSAQAEMLVDQTRGIPGSQGSMLDAQELVGATSQAEMLVDQTRGIRGSQGSMLYAQDQVGVETQAEVLVKQTSGIPGSQADALYRQNFEAVEQDVARLVAGVAKDPSYVVKPGDSVWKIIERKLDAEDMFKGLERGQRIHLIDALKDRVAAMSPDELKALGVRSGKVHLLMPGDKLDLTKVFTNDTMHDALSRTERLSARAIANIEAAQRGARGVYGSRGVGVATDAQPSRTSAPLESKSVPDASRPRAGGTGVPEASPKGNGAPITEAAQTRGTAAASSVVPEAAAVEQPATTTLRSGDFLRAESDFDVLKRSHAEFTGAKTWPSLKALMDSKRFDPSWLNRNGTMVRSHWGMISNTPVASLYDGKPGALTYDIEGKEYPMGANAELYVRSFMQQLERVQGGKELIAAAQAQGLKVGDVVAQLAREQGVEVAPTPRGTVTDSVVPERRSGAVRSAAFDPATDRARAMRTGGGRPPTRDAWAETGVEGVVVDKNYAAGGRAGAVFNEHSVSNMNLRELHDISPRTQAVVGRIMRPEWNAYQGTARDLYWSDPNFRSLVDDQIRDVALAKRGSSRTPLAHIRVNWGEYQKLSPRQALEQLYEQERRADVRRRYPGPDINVRQRRHFDIRK